MCGSWVRIVTTLAGPVAVFGVFLGAEVRRVLRRLSRRAALLRQLAERMHRPLCWFGAMVVVRITVEVGVSAGAWRACTAHVLTLALITTGAWLLAGVLIAVEKTMLSRLQVDVPDNRHARRMPTQITLVRRVIVKERRVQARAAGRTDVLAHQRIVQRGRQLPEDLGVLADEPQERGSPLHQRDARASAR
jgi:hypothetical protein